MLLVIGVVAFVFGIAVLASTHVPPSGADLADLLSKHPRDYDFSLGHMLDLNPEALGVFRGPLLGASLAFLLGPLVNWGMRRRGKPKLGNAALALMMVVLLACVHSAFVTFNPILSSHDLAVAIQKEYRRGDVMIVDGRYDQASTLNFYTGIPLHVLGEPSGNLWFGAKFPDSPKIFETPESVAALWAGPRRVFVWTDQDDPKELRGLQTFLLARKGGKAVYTNREP